MYVSSLQKNNRYSLVALDSPEVLADQLGLDLSIPTNQPVVADLIKAMVTTFSGHASGLVIEADYGLPQWTAAKPKTGLALRLEANQLTIDPLQVPTIAPNWGVEDVKNNYGVAKLELWYNPGDAQALLKKQFVSEIFDFCKYQSIELMLVLHISPIPEVQWSKVEWQEAQLQAVTELRNLTHLLVLDSPDDALATATLTTEIDSPWIVNLNQPTYEAAKDILRLSLENGAQGFLIGDTLWKELYRLRRKDAGLDLPKIEDFITKSGQDRIIELTRIVSEA